jgi:hydrogenase maturation protease
LGADPLEVDDDAPARGGGSACGGRAPILVVGVGNLLVGDDGIGPRTIEALRERELPPGIDVLEGGTLGIDLVDLIVDRRKVVVVDAVTAGAEPGTIHRLEAEELAEVATSRVSLHDLGLVDAIRLSRFVGLPPERVVVLGVEPRDLRMGPGLSPEVEKALPDLVERVLEEVRAP